MRGSEPALTSTRQAGARAELAAGPIRAGLLGRPARTFLHLVARRALAENLAEAPVERGGGAGCGAAARRACLGIHAEAHARAELRAPRDLQLPAAARRPVAAAMRGSRCFTPSNQAAAFCRVHADAGNGARWRRGAGEGARCRSDISPARAGTARRCGDSLINFCPSRAVCATLLSHRRPDGKRAYVACPRPSWPKHAVAAGHLHCC